MVKSIEDSFTDWESNTFGFGYETGEEHTIPALKKFLEAVPEEGGYDHKVLEAAIGSLTAWLFINILCHANIIEYAVLWRKRHKLFSNPFPSDSERSQ